MPKKINDINIWLPENDDDLHQSENIQFVEADKQDRTETLQGQTRSASQKIEHFALDNRERYRYDNMKSEMSSDCEDSEDTVNTLLA